MYALAACNNAGMCIGFLCEKKQNNEKFVLKDIEKIQILEQQKKYEVDDYRLITFKTKKETNEMVLQNNLGHLLLPNGTPYRYVAIEV